MKSYSSDQYGAGITQLAECQLPKLNVAGSTPVTRSILVPWQASLSRILLLSIILLIYSSTYASPIYTAPDFWLMASGYGLMNTSTPLSALDERSLILQLNNGNRKALIPLINLLVVSGRTEYAEIWMEGRALSVPVSRRDLGIALSWYGRFDLHDVMTLDLPIPPDLENDDYAPTLATILYMGWMNASEDGCFHPHIFAGTSDLDIIAPYFFPSSYHWEKDWIGMRSLDSLFAAGAREGDGR